MKEYNIDEVVRLRDEEKLQWKLIEEIIEVSSETLRKAYKRFKEGLTVTEANPNNAINLKIRGLKRKYLAILDRGGKCQKCGYDKNLAVLEFHHRSPKEKEFLLDIRAFSNHSLEKLEKELEKCDLLCANCHREHHNPELIMENIPEIIKDAQDKKSSSNKEKECKQISNRRKKEYGQTCPICGKRFPKVTGKIYCSEECKWKAKGYPSIEEINEQYELLRNWEKVAQHFGLTRKIIQGIRKRNS